MQELATAFTGEVLDPARVIPDEGGIEKGQALQFPFIQFAPELRDAEPPAGDRRDCEEVPRRRRQPRADRRRVGRRHEGALSDLHEPPSERSSEFMRLRAFDANDALVEDIKIPGVPVNSFNDLPAQWRDPAGPWLSDVRRVFDLLAGDFKGTHALFLVDYSPQAPDRPLRAGLSAADPLTEPFRDPPAAILGVVETLTRAEVERQTAEEHHRDEMVQVVVKSLEEGDKRPLFAPDTLYTVTVEVKAQIRKADKPAVKKTRNFTEQFRFRTAATAANARQPVGAGDAAGERRGEPLLRRPGAVHLQRRVGRAVVQGVRPDAHRRAAESERQSSAGAAGDRSSGPPADQGRDRHALCLDAWRS